MKALLFLAIFVTTAFSPITEAKKKKKVIYRTHTQVDLSGSSVEGRIRAPEVFYIFQRKRAKGHTVAQAPSHFRYHTKKTLEDVRRAMPK